MSETLSDVTIEHRSIEVDEQTWHIVEAGSGPTLVLLAGYPQTWYAWRRVIPLLAKTHHVIALDLPGQGDSGETTVGYDTWTTSGLLASLLDHLGIDDLLLAGHDVGAWVSYSFAHRYPERLRGVVLLDGNIASVNLDLDAGTSWGGWHFVFNRIPDLPEALFTGKERTVVEWFLRNSAIDWKATFTEADIDEYVRAFSRPGSLRGMLGYYRAVPQNTIRNAELSHERLTVPTLALVGNHSGSRDLVAGLLSQTDDLRSVVFENARHYLPEEQPATTADVILEFATSLPQHASDRLGRASHSIPNVRPV